MPPSHHISRLCLFSHDESFVQQIRQSLNMRVSLARSGDGQLEGCVHIFASHPLLGSKELPRRTQSMLVCQLYPGQLQSSMPAPWASLKPLLL